MKNETIIDFFNFHGTFMVPKIYINQYKQNKNDNNNNNGDNNKKKNYDDNDDE